MPLKNSDLSYGRNGVFPQSFTEAKDSLDLLLGNHSATAFSKEEGAQWEPDTNGQAAGPPAGSVMGANRHCTSTW